MLVEYLQKQRKKKETGDSRYVYQNELDKACFQHDMITRRTAFGTTLRDKAFNIAKNPKYDRYQKDLSSMVYKFFDKKFQAEQLKMKIFPIKN